MSAQIPKTWTQVAIGTVARVVGGGTPPSKVAANFAVPGQGIPWITPADLSGYRAQTISRGTRDLTTTGLAACGATPLPKGTVLFSSRAPIGYVAIAANEISTNQGFKSFVFPDGFDPRFAYYQLKHLKPEAEAIATGTTFKELSGAAASTLSFKVAPSSEQTRIADQLDTLLARVQDCNDRLDAVPELLRRFRQSILKAAIVGDLTKAWRDTQGLADELQTVQLDEDEVQVPAAWRIVDVETVIDPLRPLCYGVVQPGEGGTGEIPLIRVQDMIGGGIAVSKLRTVSTSIDEDYRRSRVKGGDLLMSVVGTIGRTALVPDGLRANIARAVARIACRSGVRSDWLHHWFSSEPLQWHLLSSSKEVARKTLNLSDLARIAVPLPSPAEQEEISQKVKAWLAIADRVAARSEGAVSQAKRISTLLLAKAFRGELIPQDPNDEPASELLARIAAQRDQTAATPKARKPRSTRAPQETHAMTKSRHDDDVMGQPYLAHHLRRLGMPSPAEALFKVAELPVADFYKQLAWEVEHGHVKDRQSLLEPGDAA